MPDFIPEGYSAISPYLLNEDAHTVIRFLEEVFGATVNSRDEDDEGRIIHADLSIHDSHVMLGNATDEWPPIPSSCYIFVPDVDQAYRRALERNGRSLMEPTDMPYGHRSCGIQDPGGNTWWIATPIAEGQS